MRNYSIPPRRPHSTQQEREELVAKYQSSGLRQREFAQQHGVKLSTFQQWIYRPRLPQRIARTKKPAFQEVSITEVPFLNSWAAELQLPRGVTLRLNSQASAEWIGALVQKLGQTC
jgi:transposase-like protein